MARNESGDDLSSFALPHLAGEDKMKQHMELLDKNSSNSLQEAADTVWTTPPNTPVNGSRRQDGGSRPRATSDSYEKAMLNAEKLWDWQQTPTSSSVGKEGGGKPTAAREQKPSHVIPKHISSPAAPPSHLHNPLAGKYKVQHITVTTKPKAHIVTTSGNVSKSHVVTSSPTKVHVGFVPNVPLETTKPSELPGTDDDVIATPPRPLSAGARPRVQSIEQVDKMREKYVPQASKRALDFGGRGGGRGRVRSASSESSEQGGNSFCLDISSFIGSQSPDSGRGESIAFRKKLSLATSELSTISNPGSYQDPHSLDNYEVVNEDMYAALLKERVCYDIIPASTKIVVFDTRLRVKKAFFALVANGFRAAPLWDSSQQGFVGMLTITDFIHILRHHYKSPIVGMDELENQTIQMWRDSEKELTNIKSTLLQIGPDQSLYDGVRMLVEYKIHRLPVIDPTTGDALYVLTHKRILQYLFPHIMDGPQPSYLSKSLQELGIGTHKNIAVASQDTPIIVALNMFAERRISALPIVDASGKIVDIYAKFDVINLAAERTYGNLDVSLREALKHRNEGFEGAHTCHTCLPTESLYTIIKRIVSTKVHRLVIVNAQQQVVGVASLSDILKFLVVTSHT